MSRTDLHPLFDQCLGKACLDGAKVTVRVAATHSHTGAARDKIVAIDSCVADLVEALYPMAASSCCGHRQTEGRILLYDGRVLRIYNHTGVPGAMPKGAWGYEMDTEPVVRLAELGDDPMSNAQELQDALDRHEASHWNNRLTKDSPIVEAARLVANSNIQAATRYAVQFFMGDKVANKPIPSHIQTGVERIVTMALTRPGDTK